MDLNFIVIPIVIIIITVMSSRYTMRGLQSWYENLRKPLWSPSGLLIKEIWIFVYVVFGLSVLWYWNVPVVHWLHYVTSVMFLVNAYLLVTWNKIFFEEHDLKKALGRMNFILFTAVIAAGLMAFDSLIAVGIVLPYIFWLVIIFIMNKRIIQMNPATEAYNAE